MDMIIIKNLNKSFGNFQTLNNLSLTVRKGEIYGFIGRNGAGKSTTMNIIAGLSKADSGTCIVNGKDVRTINHPSDLKIGYLPESPNFYGWMTAYEILAFLAEGLDKKFKQSRINTLLTWVGLDKVKNRRVGGFSRGMKQRLGIAAALIHDPELLIFDEPSSALDPQGRSDVIKLIQDLKTMGKTIILSTHILSDVERVCDRIGMINHGRIVVEDSLQRLLNHHTEPILDIQFEHDHINGLQKQIEAIDGVITTQIQHDLFTIKLKDKRILNKIMHVLSEDDFGIHSMAFRKTTLEVLFIEEVA